MKKSMLILSIVILSLTGLKAQENLSSKNEPNNYTKEINEDDLYLSLVQDFDNWYKSKIEDEINEDKNHLNTYLNLYENFKLIKDIEDDKNEDSKNEELYISVVLSMNDNSKK